MSLKKIAQMTGASASTVSRVLNNGDYKCNDPLLKERIWQAAKELSYVPNAAAKSLRTGVGQEAFTVDILLARFDSLKSDSFFKELYDSVREGLMKKNCAFGDFLNVPDILAGEKEKQTRKKPGGLIILGKCPGELVPVLKKKYTHIVGIDRNPTEFEYDEVVCSGVTAAQTAVNYLISLGHRKIAYIGDCTYETRYMGYYRALSENKIPLDYNSIFPTDQTRRRGFEAYLSILEKESLPTGIFCANDATALGVLEAMKKHKRRGYLPSVISIDNIRESEKTTPMLTTVDIPKRDMGRFAASVLADKMSGNYTGNVRAMFPCRLIIRESCTYCNY